MKQFFLSQELIDAAKLKGFNQEPAAGPSNGNQGGDFVVDGIRIRRLTPTECERLQGFPDGYTAVPGASDTARYKALGNSMAVPVMKWIAERIDAVDKILIKNTTL